MSSNMRLQNYGVLEVDGTLSTPYGYVYNYGTLQGTGTVNGANAYRLQLRHAEPRLTTASEPGILNTGNIYQSSGRTSTSDSTAPALPEPTTTNWT